ncbi:uncharacterized protein [Nicotiana tomentosiformis]|uniref:uncharacterized protein n=1 Tax=Nicotiana tomentosiformis TaxID=4098 RepID=UPI00388C9863
MAASSGGPIFLKSINLSGVVKGREYIANLFIKSFEEVGASNVVQVITDNATLSLLKVAEMRFASHVVMASHVHQVKASLERMVMDDDWRNYKGDKVIEAKTREIKSLVMNDEWWDKIEYFLKFTEPIVSMLRSADLDAPKLHLVYDMWDTMIEKVKAIIFEQEGNDLIVGQSYFFYTIQEILVVRWYKSNTLLHCMAYFLVPKYYHESWLKGEGNGVRRLAPNENREISLNRVKYFQRYFKDSNDLKQASLEYGVFASGSGFFSEPHVVEAMMYEEPLSWWANHGVNALLLQSLAYKLLSQPASSSCCERNWSTYSLIHSIKRNKLETSRAEDLIFVYYNLCLFSRQKETYTSGPSKYWDVGGDRFDVDEATNDLLDLLIDEPQLEGVIFEEEIEDVQEIDLENIEEEC